MKKKAQNKQSALLRAGENSLLYLNQQSQLGQLNFNQSREDFDKKNHLVESNVKSIYKRNNAQEDYSPHDPNSTLKYYPPNTQEHNNKKNQSPSFYPQNYPLSPKHLSKFNNNTNHYRSLQLQSKLVNPKSTETNMKSNHYTTIQNKQLKQLMLKLTLPRLRKMQALVRGFLVRRKVYPKLLQEYTVAKSVLGLVEANVIYREISSIIMETITFPKYQTNENNINDLYYGKARQLEQAVYDSILSRVIRKQLKPVIQDSIIEKGILLSRPQITFGFNLRNPLQLLLYEKLMEIIHIQLKQISTQGIKQAADDCRQLFIVTQWMEKYGMLKQLYKQIAEQLIEENMGQYVVQDMLDNMVKQASYAVSLTVYNQEVNNWYFQQTKQLQTQARQLLFQEIIGQALMEMEYGVVKDINNQNEQINKINPNQQH